MDAPREAVNVLTNYKDNGQNVTYADANQSYVRQNYDVLEIGPTIPPNPPIQLNPPTQPETLFSAELARAYYSTEVDYVELQELLESWNVGEFFNYFQRKYNLYSVFKCINLIAYLEQQIYVGVLKHLTDELAKDLMAGSKFTVGLRIEFLYQWKKWVHTNESKSKNEQYVILRHANRANHRYREPQHRHDQLLI